MLFNIQSEPWSALSQAFLKRLASTPLSRKPILSRIDVVAISNASYFLGMHAR